MNVSVPLTYNWPEIRCTRYTYQQRAIGECNLTGSRRAYRFKIMGEELSIPFTAGCLKAFTGNLFPPGQRPESLEWHIKSAEIYPFAHSVSSPPQL